MTETKHQKVRLRPFAGMVNRAKEILVPVYYASPRENEDGHEEGFCWLPITKATAKQLIEEATEAGIEEIEGVTEEDGSLYIDGPEDDDEAGNDEEDSADEKTTGLLE